MESRVIQPLSIAYRDIRPRIHNGMIALCRPTSFRGRAICLGTGATYSHATMLGWAEGGTLMVGETIQHRDARLVDAASEFANYPGCYDVFHVNAVDYDGVAAWRFICHAGGTKYGWRHLSRVFARRVLGLDLRPIANSDDPRYPRDCSALVHAALRLSGGRRLREFDCDCVPGDLSDPAFFDYLGTVV
jgi:hypothetical protein